MFIYTYTYIAF